MQALWMVLASFWFALMAVGIKFASNSFGTLELVLYRGLVSMVFMAIVVRARGATLRTPVPMMHVWRSTIGVLSLSAWFYAIAHLPLATAMTLNYMSSVWIAAFLVGGALLAWRPGQGAGPLQQGPLVLTVMAGFVGVVMVLRPSLDQNEMFAGLIGLLSGLGAAFAYMQVMALSRIGEPEARTVFYFATGSAIAGGIGVLLVGTQSTWDWAAALWLLPIGLLAALGQLFMTRAYSGAKTEGAMLTVASLQYSGIVFAAIYSLVLFGDRITAMGWAGMGLITASGIAATVLRARAAPNAPAEEH
jgi:S-adenosylmethionine uptake transporter